MRTCRSGVVFSTQSSGSMVMRRGRPKVSTTYCESVPTTSIFLVFGLAVGLDAQLDRHAEEVEVLADLADGAEALVVAQPVDGVLVGELRRAGAVDPLREEGESSCCIALRLGHLLEVGGADALVGVLAESAAAGWLRKASSPISQRSMWKTIAPFSRVIDWNCGEKGVQRPTLDSGMVS